MEDADIRSLLDSSMRLVMSVSMDFRRYLQSKIDWNDRLICIKGPKGTGKTTLILQHIKEIFGAQSEKAVYLAADHIWFASHDIMEAVDYFNSHGYTHLFIDEVHHLPEWSRIIKTITDFYPQLNVVYSGSSILKLSKGSADLSRRQAVYNLKGLSFREFLSFTSTIEHESVPLADILRSHRDIAGDICAKVKILPLFEKYLEIGYYPIFQAVSAQFSERLVEIVNMVLDVDFPAIEDVTPATIRKTKKMLMVLAASCPQQPNMSALYRELETNRNLGLKMLGALERAELISSIATGADKIKNLSRPEKIFLGDTNLMYALVGNVQMGAVRETYFLNQLRAAGHLVMCPPAGDFLVDGRHLFEVGGRGKGFFDQIKDIPDSFVANDGVEVGFGNKIPLWLFGFMY